MAYLYLMIAIAGELIGSSLLKATDGFTKLVPTTGVVISYVGAFFFLALSLKSIPLNIAYAVWSGLGIIATTAISILIWKEKLNFGSVIGILLIIAGVVVLNMMGPGHDGEAMNDEYEDIAVDQQI
ncbi:Spermidine export protein mdtJ [Gracilibacillus halophilus YIM-C55.5]|uniref:Spermidine export protein mdtJ n=1 Tax=Gracilibacillus halophilus YIM-C55.5 TaxID=1308866 RepID=N4WN54_9BACI|nr:multidrug efflux SMR transporter [Gracilibacillus halophilus]ENH97552.1 Spermidine export protein mdtJ [Gracilibacillus halophilus YIM-C55.5]